MVCGCLDTFFVVAGNHGNQFNLSSSTHRHAGTALLYSGTEIIHHRHRVHGLPKEEAAIMDVIIKCLAILQVNVLYVQLMQGPGRKKTQNQIMRASASNHYGQNKLIIHQQHWR